MRPLALFTLLLSFIVLVLSFLCIFAGSKPSSLTNYYIIALNTSEIGGGGGGFIGSLANGVAEKAGIAEFYSLYTLDYCEGTFSGAAATNLHATFCSAHLKRITPGEALQSDLDKAGHGDVNIDSLGWDPEIDTKFGLLYDVRDAGLALYACAIGFSFFAICCSIFWFFSVHGRCWIILTSLFAFLAFLTGGVASGATTAIAVKGTSIFNQYGDKINVVAHRGNKFMALTWAMTAVALIAWICSFVAICLPSARRERRAKRISV